jgi:hypothetical protein
MPKTIYTAEATVTGGRIDGCGRTTDGRLDLSKPGPTAITRSRCSTG